MGKPTETITFAELPDVVALRNKGDRNRAQELLAELDGHTFCFTNVGVEVRRDQRVEEIKAELSELQTKHGWPGMRHGPLCFTAQEVPGRKSLDKGLLMEKLGLTMDQIDDCSREGQPYMRRTFKKIDEE